MNEGDRALLEFKFPTGSTWEGEGDGRIVLQAGRLRLERRSGEGDYWYAHPSENAAEAADLVFREMLKKVRDRDAEIFEMANEEWVND